MSYDIYCYKSSLGKPDVEEAEQVLEFAEENETSSDHESKLKIAKALLEFNPKLEIFEFDYEYIARFQGISIEEAKQQNTHIEINTPEGELAIQLIIFDNNVAISTPYWYSGENANSVFDLISAYTKIIHKVAGYFVYDPQTEKVADPMIENIFDADKYQNVTQKIYPTENTEIGQATSKPWWKFW